EAPGAPDPAATVRNGNRRGGHGPSAHAARDAGGPAPAHGADIEHMGEVDVERGAERPERGTPARWIYRNLTPWRIESDEPTGDGCCGIPTIPPLGELRVSEADARCFDTGPLRRRRQIELRPDAGDVWSVLPRLVLILGWALLIWGWVVTRALTGATTPPSRHFVAALLIVPVLAAASAIGRDLLFAHRFRRFRRGTEAEGGTHGELHGIIAPRSFEGVVWLFPRVLSQAVVLGASVAIAVVGAGAAIYEASQLRDLLTIDVGALLTLRDPVQRLDDAVRDSPAFWQLLVGHAAQWVFVSAAALAPAAMYFQFDRDRLAAIQHRWVQHVFRLDPTVRSVPDVEAKYGAQIDAAFGSLHPDSRLRLRQGRRSPVVVATVLLTVGWILFAMATPVPTLEEAVVGGEVRYVWPELDDEGMAVVDASNVDLPGGGAFPVIRFFRPVSSTLGFAFLGAYLFSLNLVIRGYRRRDLRPKTYNTIAVRILSAVIISVVLGGLPEPTGWLRLLLAFFAGVVPESALLWLRERLTSRGAVTRIVPFDEPSPLTHLDGIDLYDRTRLAEEGINNVQSLAHADIVELMSSTRIPADRLVDWVDQALLYLRPGGARPTDERNDDAPDTEARLRHLRRYGIRTASDLFQAYTAALERGRREGERLAAQRRPADAALVDLVAEMQREEVDLLRRTLRLPGGGPAGSSTGRDEAPGADVQLLVDTLSDEEWFTQIRNWRDSEFGTAMATRAHLDGSTGVRVERDRPRAGEHPAWAARVRRLEDPLTPVPLVPRVDLRDRTEDLRTPFERRPEG
ncbi:MAG: hypothetical protein S0880_07535, partial [Actinomycetota bacterium]|nr:hypothetical protein [Actinomycetota bacterium]